MRDQLIALAGHPTKVEAVDALERALERYGPVSIDPVTISDDVHADRR